MQTITYSHQMQYATLINLSRKLGLGGGGQRGARLVAGMRGKPLIKVRRLTAHDGRPPDGVITPTGTARADRVVGVGLAGLLSLAA